MQRIGNLFENFASYSNLHKAFKKAMKGSKGKGESVEYFFNMENVLIELKKEIESNNYEPSDYRYFTIYDPKERKIAVAPFKDRIVHHAIVNILEPIYEKIFIYDSYATRKKKGSHKAIKRAQEFLKKNKWFLKTDINKYFENMNHEILLNIIKRKIKDKKLIYVIEKIMNKGGENGVGLPIGNLTSQFFANVYLNNFDHYVKEELKTKCYIRYMDDIVVFSNDKGMLLDVRNNLRDFLLNNLKLQLKDSETIINQRLNGLSFLGVRIFPNLIRIKRENLKRSMTKYKRNIEKFRDGKIEEKYFLQSMASIIGHLKNFNSYSLRKNIYLGQLS